MSVATILSTVTLAVAAADADAATSTGASTSASTATGPPSGSQLEPLTRLAWGTLGLTLLGVVAVLIFLYAYHRMVLGIVATSVRRGQHVQAAHVPVLPGDGGVGVQSKEPKITSDLDGAQPAPGQDVTFRLEGLSDGDDPATTTWASEHGSPAIGAGATFSSRAPGQGAWTVTATRDGQAPVTLELSVASTRGDGTVGSAPVVELPFALRGWGGLIVTIIGIGVVVALMFARVVSAEGGLGILGTLVGVGAVTASAAAKGGAGAGEVSRSTEDAAS